jgi:hypothetical protein
MLATIARAAAIAAIAGSLLAGTAFAASNPSPTGTGPPSQMCQQLPGRPGNAANAPGSPFNETGAGGTGGLHYSAKSQYDVACYQVSQR